jgi:hypothetical protein
MQGGLNGKAAGICGVEAKNRGTLRRRAIYGDVRVVSIKGELSVYEMMVCSGAIKVALGFHRSEWREVGCKNN